MSRHEHDSESERAVPPATAPAAIAVVSLSAVLAFDTQWVPLIGLVNVVFALHATLDTRARERTITGWRRVLDPGLTLVLAGTATCAVALLGGADPQLRTTCLLVGTVLALVAVALMLVERFRALALELLVEAVAGSIALAVFGWQLAVKELLPAGQALTLQQLQFFVVASWVCAFMLVLALVATDGDRLGPTIWLSFVVVVTIGVLDVAALGPQAIARGHDLLVPDVAGIGVLALATTARIHPDAARRRGPAIHLRRGATLYRSAMLVAAAMSGPTMLLVHLTVGLDLSMRAVAIVAFTVSLIASLRLLHLMTRWGSLEHRVFHDSLTGLPNRALFLDRLAAGIESARFNERTLALMFLDLDRFKNVNDSLGHASGNSLLVQVAERLSSCVGRDVTIARLSGDEFGVLVPEVASYRHTTELAERLVGTFAKPFKIGRRSIYVTSSIGVAHYPTDGTNATTLLEHADAAMYRAKERGRNTFEFYTNESRRQATNRLDLESALHEALSGGQLRLLYQPKVDVSTNEVFGVEALLRWHHPVLGPISPDEFIPLAEESGVIDPLGEWTLYEACAQAERWRVHHGLDLSVAVNLSPRQFELRRVQTMVRDAVLATSIDPQRLELELTESLALRDSVEVTTVLHELKELGVRLAIDDFGVGYSGLGYLNRFDFDLIKIDRKFVQTIGASGAAIVRAVIGMANGLGLEVVAEGVETREQVEFLRHEGCRYMQGFFFSKPMPGDRLADLLVERRSRLRETVPAAGALVPVRGRLARAAADATQDPRPSRTGNAAMSRTA